MRVDTCNLEFQASSQMNQQSDFKKSISLRKFPYPYRAGFTICSDIDGTTFEDFVTIHSFLNSKENTPLGRGLGLELADSFWFYSNRNTQDHAFCYFEEDNKTPSKYAPAIRELIKTGYIDTLHSYGNFSKFGGFSRQLAERCLEELDKHSLKLETWVNHGDEYNSQNIGSASYQLGDKPVEFISATSNYHSDIMIDAGFTYFWDQETSLTKIIGQDRSFQSHEAYFNNLLTPGFPDRFRMLAKFGLNRWKKDKIPLLQNNQLLNQIDLADGNSLLHFKRYGSGRYDWSDDLPLLLHSKMLTRLTEKEGSCILYVHWGDRKNRNSPQPFSAATVKAFEYLASLFYSGKLWVTTTCKLLNYSFLVNEMDWNVKKNENGYEININGHNNHSIKQKIIQKNDLQELTFYTPKPEATVIQFNHKMIPTTINPKDETGRQSISIPLKRLEFPTDIM